MSLPLPFFIIFVRVCRNLIRFILFFKKGRQLCAHPSCWIFALWPKVVTPRLARYVTWLTLLYIIFSAKSIRFFFFKKKGRQLCEETTTSSQTDQHCLLNYYYSMSPRLLFSGTSFFYNFLSCAIGLAIRNHQVREKWQICRCRQSVNK